MGLMHAIDWMDQPGWGSECHQGGGAGISRAKAGLDCNSEIRHRDADSKYMRGNMDKSAIALRRYKKVATCPDLRLSPSCRFFVFWNVPTVRYPGVTFQRLCLTAGDLIVSLWLWLPCGGCADSPTWGNKNTETENPQKIRD